MKEEEIREGDIVEIDYIAEFTKEHINEGKALVIWKGHNNQPLVRKLNTKNTIWICYEHIARVVGHIDIEGYMDKALNDEPKTGHWIMPQQDDGMSDPIYYQVRCSECGFNLDPQTWHQELHQYGADKYCPKCGRKMYEDKGVLEQLSEKQNNLLTTTKAWSDAIEKNGYVN